VGAAELELPQQRRELDISDLSGRIQTRRDVAGQAGGSIGSDADQSLTQYVNW
jgi:hypothetical protein